MLAAGFKTLQILGMRGCGGLGHGGDVTCMFIVFRFGFLALLADGGSLSASFDVSLQLR